MSRGTVNTVKVSSWREPGGTVTFDDLAGLHSYVTVVGKVSTLRPMRWKEMHWQVQGEHLVQDGLTTSLRLSYLAFDQLCKKLEAPAAFLRKLDVHTVRRVLQEINDAEGQTNALLAPLPDGSRLLRGWVKDHRSMLWDHQVTRAMYDSSAGWVPRNAIWGETGVSISMVQQDPCFSLGSYTFSRGFTLTHCEANGKSLELHPFLYESATGAWLYIVPKRIGDFAAAARSGQVGMFGLLHSYMAYDTFREQNLLSLAARNECLGTGSSALVKWIVGHSHASNAEAVQLAAKLAVSNVGAGKVSMLQVALFAGADPATRHIVPKLLSLSTKEEK